MPKPAHGYDKPLTEKGELSDRGKTKLKAQINKAESIMRVEKNANRGTSKTFYQAKRMRDRAQKLLGPKPSPDKKPSTNEKDKYAKRREPFEKVTRTSRIKAGLVGVAKRAQQANEGG